MKNLTNKNNRTFINNKSEEAIMKKLTNVLSSVKRIINNSNKRLGDAIDSYALPLMGELSDILVETIRDIYQVRKGVVYELEYMAQAVGCPLRDDENEIIFRKSFTSQDEALAYWDFVNTHYGAHSLFIHDNLNYCIKSHLDNKQA